MNLHGIHDDIVLQSIKTHSPVTIGELQQKIRRDWEFICEYSTVSKALCNLFNSGKLTRKWKILDNRNRVFEYSWKK